MSTTGVPQSFLAFVAGLRVKLTPGQRVLALVAFDGVDPCDLDSDDREIARTLFGDLERVPDGARHVLAAVCGARAGKSYVLVGLRMLHLALIVDLSTLAPGEVAAAIIVAPDLRLARQSLRFARGAVESVSALRRLVTTDGEDAFVIRREQGRAVSIECLPATRGGSATRGRSLVGAALDEASFFRDAESVVNDSEVYRSVAPRVMRGGQVVIASTAWAELGLLFELHRDNFGSPTAALVAHAPTTVLRDEPHIIAYVERERARDSENARREFDAEFMSAGSGRFFPNDALSRTADHDAPTIGKCFAGGDLAFRSDSAAIAIVRSQAPRFGLVEVLELRPTKGNPLSPSRVVDAFADVMKRHKVRSIVLDSHYLESARELFWAHNIHVVETPGGQEAKASTYIKTRTLLAEERLFIAAHEQRILAQLRNIVSKPQPGGGLSISSPRSARAGHGDLVSAFVLATCAALDASFELPLDAYRGRSSTRVGDSFGGPASLTSPEPQGYFADPTCGVRYGRPPHHLRGGGF